MVQCTGILTKSYNFLSYNIRKFKENLEVKINDNNVKLTHKYHLLFTLLQGLFATIFFKFKKEVDSYHNFTISNLSAQCGSN